MAGKDDNVWKTRVAEAWASFDEHDELAFLALVERLAAELQPEDPSGLFERASALDAIGREAGRLPACGQQLRSPS